MINMLGTEASFEILNVMEYSSARGRMSVIARSPQGSVRLLSKGSDSKVMRILHEGMPKALLDATNQNLHLFATQVLPPRRPASEGILDILPPRAVGSGAHRNFTTGDSIVTCPAPQFHPRSGRTGVSISGMLAFLSRPRSSAALQGLG